jgi:hypothetical protein
MKGLTFGVCWAFGPVLEGDAFLSGVIDIIHDEDLRLMTSGTVSAVSRAFSDDDETG